MTGLRTWQEELRDRGWQEGRREGRQDKKLEIAGNMIRGGVDDQTIVNYTGLSVESVADLKRTLNGAG